MAIKLVENWRSGWKWISTQCMLLATAVLTAWNELPANFIAMIPDPWPKRIAVVLLILGILGRFVQQRPPEVPAPAPADPQGSA